MIRRHHALMLASALAVATMAAECGPNLAPCTGDVCVTGTMRYFNLEGGFWAIRGDDSVTYDPITPLADEFKHDGLRVQLDARERKDMGGIHMAGPLVEVIALRRLD